MYRSLRFGVIKTLGEVVVSPFSQVRFRQYFLADVLMSMSKPFEDLNYAGCFYSTDAWLHSQQPFCNSTVYINYLFAPVTNYIRIMQSLRRYKETGLYLHNLNAFKYTCTITYHVLSIFKN